MNNKKVCNFFRLFNGLCNLRMVSIYINFFKFINLILEGEVVGWRGGSDFVFLFSIFVLGIIFWLLDDVCVVEFFDRG